MSPSKTASNYEAETYIYPENTVESILVNIKNCFHEEEKARTAFSLDRLDYIEQIFNYYFQLGQHLQKSGKKTLAEVVQLDYELILDTAKQIAEQYYRIQVFLENYYSKYIEFSIECDSFRICKLRSAIEFFFGMYDKNMDLGDDYGQLKDYFDIIKFEGSYYELDERFKDWWMRECRLEDYAKIQHVPKQHWWWF